MVAKLWLTVACFDLQSIESTQLLDRFMQVDRSRDRVRRRRWLRRRCHHCETPLERFTLVCRRCGAGILTVRHLGMLILGTGLLLVLLLLLDVI